MRLLRLFDNFLCSVFFQNRIFLATRRLVFLFGVLLVLSPTAWAQKATECDWSNWTSCLNSEDLDKAASSLMCSAGMSSNWCEEDKKTTLSEVVAYKLLFKRSEDDKLEFSLSVTGNSTEAVNYQLCPLGHMDYDLLLCQSMVKTTESEYTATYTLTSNEDYLTFAVLLDGNKYREIASATYTKKVKFDNAKLDDIKELPNGIDITKPVYLFKVTLDQSYDFKEKFSLFYYDKYGKYDDKDKLEYHFSCQEQVCILFVQREKNESAFFTALWGNEKIGNVLNQASVVKFNAHTFAIDNSKSEDGKVRFNVILKDEQDQADSRQSSIASDLHLFVTQVGIGGNTVLNLQKPAKLSAGFTCEQFSCKADSSLGEYPHMQIEAQLDGKAIGQKIDYQSQSPHKNLRSTDATLTVLENTEIIRGGKIHIELTLNGVLGHLDPDDVIQHLSLYKNAIKSNNKVEAQTTYKENDKVYQITYGRVLDDEDNEDADFYVYLGQMQLSDGVSVRFSSLGLSQSTVNWHSGEDRSSLHSSSDQPYKMTAGQLIHIEVDLKDKSGQAYHSSSVDYSNDLKLVHIPLSDAHSPIPMPVAFKRDMDNQYSAQHYLELAGDYALGVRFQGQEVSLKQVANSDSRAYINVSPAELNVKQTALSVKTSSSNAQSKWLEFRFTPTDRFGNVIRGITSIPQVHLMRAHKGSAVYRAVHSININKGTTHRGNSFSVAHNEETLGIWRYALAFNNKTVEKIDLTTDLTDHVEVDVSTLSSKPVASSSEVTLSKVAKGIPIRSNPNYNNHQTFYELVLNKGAQTYRVTYTQHSKNFSSHVVPEEEPDIQVVAIAGNHGLEKKFLQDDFVLATDSAVLDLFRYTKNIRVERFRYDHDENKNSIDYIFHHKMRDQLNQTTMGPVDPSWIEEHKDKFFNAVAEVVSTYSTEITDSYSPGYAEQQQFHQDIQSNIKIADENGDMTTFSALSSEYALSHESCSLDKSASQQISYKFIYGDLNEEKLVSLNLEFLDLDNNAQAIRVSVQTMTKQEGALKITSSPVSIEGVRYLLDQLISQDNKDIKSLLDGYALKAGSRTLDYIIEFEDKYPPYAYSSNNQKFFLSQKKDYIEKVKNDNSHQYQLPWIYLGWKMAKWELNALSKGTQKIEQSISSTLATEALSSDLTGEDRRQAVLKKLNQKQQQMGVFNTFIRNLYSNKFDVAECKEALKDITDNAAEVDQSNQQDTDQVNADETDFWFQFGVQAGLMVVDPAALVMKEMDGLQTVLAEIDNSASGTRWADLYLVDEGGDFDGLAGSGGSGGSGGGGGNTLKSQLQSQEQIVELFASQLSDSAESQTARITMGASGYGGHILSMSAGGALYLMPVPALAISSSLLAQAHYNGGVFEVDMRGFSQTEAGYIDNFQMMGWLEKGESWKKNADNGEVLERGSDRIVFMDKKQPDRIAGLLKTLPSGGNLTIYLNKDNHHWTVLNIRKGENGKVTYQYANSLHQTEEARDAEIDKIEEIVDKATLDSALPYPGWHKFTIPEGHTQDYAQCTNECGAYAMSFGQSMRQGKTQSEADSVTIGKLSKEIRAIESQGSNQQRLAGGEGGEGEERKDQTIEDGYFYDDDSCSVDSDTREKNTVIQNIICRNNNSSLIEKYSPEPGDILTFFSNNQMMRQRISVLPHSNYYNYNYYSYNPNDQLELSGYRLQGQVQVQGMPYTRLSVGVQYVVEDPNIIYGHIDSSGGIQSDNHTYTLP